HAIAVKGNMIIYAGDDYKSYKGSNTRMEDVKGKMIVQGFIDNHTHYSKVGVFHSPCAVAAPTIFILRSSFVVGNIIIHMLSHNH
ncbi:MAG: hypothetical protein SFU87_18930, partial [Chitinophagaceae bacterium]|nr:hypothetical protein [Chitinophagaceae bacterium]